MFIGLLAVERKRMLGLDPFKVLKGPLRHVVKQNDKIFCQMFGQVLGQVFDQVVGKVWKNTLLSLEDSNPNRRDS